MDWSREEVDLIVANYLQMLMLELSGQTYSKTEHRQRLLPLLNGRTAASVEFKHQNISAALGSLGYPSIRGYAQLPNFQGILASALVDHLRGNSPLDQIATASVQQPAVTPLTPEFSRVKTAAPVLNHKIAEPTNTPEFKAMRRDYLAREAANLSLGLAGEEFVVQFEHWRLNQFGQKRLADRVEYVSKTKGDGLGYDVLSFDADGRERYIEVKTTSFGKETAFFVSNNELAFSKQAKDHFHLYRLFAFRKQPKFFDLPGRLDLNCRLNPVSFRADFG